MNKTGESKISSNSQHFTMEHKENIKKNSTKEFPLLDNIKAVFSVRDQERKKRLEVAKVKNEVNKVHVQFIKNNLLSKDEYTRAGPAVSEWAKKNGVNRNETKMIKRRSNFDKIAFSDTTLKRQRIVNSVMTSPLQLLPLQSNQKNSTARFRPELASNNFFDFNRNSTVSSTQSFINDSQMSIRNNHTDAINNIIQSEDLDSSEVLIYTPKNVVEPIIDLTQDSEVEGHRKEPFVNSVLNAESSLKPLQCKVLNCEVTCDSIMAYGNHYQRFFHSPCNPFINMPDSSLDVIPLLYNCPRCEETFHRKLDCQEHMIFEDHLPTLLPIPICGYMCPQCCLIFRNIIQCHTHMSNSNHCNVTYAFAGDAEQVLSGNIKSIPISYYLANQFYLKCQAKLFKVSCIVCDIEVKTSDELDEHISNTGHQHFQSSSTLTPEEVFAEFLTDKTCSKCAKIIWEGDTEKGFHACDRTQIGWLVDNDNCKTFKEFVRRCSVTQENETRQDSDVEITVMSSDSENMPMEHYNILSTKLLSIHSSYTIKLTTFEMFHENDDLNTNNNAEKKPLRLPNYCDCDLICLSESKTNVVDRSVKISKASLSITTRYKNGHSNYSQKFCRSKNKRNLMNDGFQDAEDSSDSSSLDSFLSCSSLLESCHNIPLESKPYSITTSRKRKREPSIGGLPECEPSVSTWILNSGEDKQESTYNTDYTSTTRAITRSTNSPAKKCLQISKHKTESASVSITKGSDSIFTNTPPSPSKKFEMNCGPLSPSANKKQPAQNMETLVSNNYDKLSKNARRKLRRKLRQQEIKTSSTQNNPESSSPFCSNVGCSPTVHTKDPSLPGIFNKVAQPLSDQDATNYNKPAKNVFSGVSTEISQITQPNTFDKLSKKKRKLQNMTEVQKSLVPSNPGSSFGGSASPLRCDTDGDNISTENLSRMHLVIFLDLDNWPIFFKRLPQCLPDKTFVWTFYGGNTVWKQPKSLPFLKLKKANCFHLHHQCGKTKDAADFAICFTIGKMDDRLPKSVPFAILSGDRGFCEIERQMKNSSRRTVVIDPHEAHKHSAYMIYTMILSVMGT